MNFFGSVINCNVKLSGASRFEGFDFTAITLDCELSGASRMEITCEGAMKVKASGASKVLYKGNCVITSIETSGASEVIKSDRPVLIDVVAVSLHCVFIRFMYGSERMLYRGVY